MNNSLSTAIIYDHDHTELGLKTTSICSFTQLPKVGEYIMLSCGKQACRVNKIENIKEQGCTKHLIIVSDPTLIHTNNKHGDKGVPVRVHHRHTDCHYISEYFLARSQGYAKQYKLKN